MRIRRKAKKWVLNLWTIAMVILSASGMNSFEALDSKLLHTNLDTSIVRDAEAWIEVTSGPDGRCILLERSIGGGVVDPRLRKG